MSSQPSAASLCPGLVALVRFANAAFFLVAATYCVLTYSSFAYQQFIRPHLVAALSSFVVWHPLWHWVMLGLTALTMFPERRRTHGKAIAWVYLGVMGAVGAVLVFRPVLPSVDNDALGLQLAYAFLVPPGWLAFYDHLATSDRFDPRPSDRRRLVIAVLAAALAVWLAHAIGAPFRVEQLGELTMSRGGFVFGVFTSLAIHVGVFWIIAVAAVAALHATERMAQGSGRAEHAVIGALAALAVMLVIAVLVFGSLSFRGWSAWFLAAEAALMVAATWSAASRRLAQAGDSAVDAWFRPLSLAGPRVALVALLLLPVASFVAVERIATFDWDFLVQNLCLLAVWCIAVGAAHVVVRSVRVRASRPPAPAVAAALVMVVAVGVRGNIGSGLSAGLTRPTFVPEFTLDAYAAIDPSYRLLRQFLRVDVDGSAEFYAYLRANSLIQHVDIEPIDVDFVKPLVKAAMPPPHIFLFVIDSLRRDYLSPYNPAVTFTPAFGRLAAEGYAFERAFTRYGGTGLSMPAIWAGGMLLHKEYVLPFSRMNALEKLLAVNGYRSLISMDHITEQLLNAPETVTELDHGRDEMQYDFCATLGELGVKLEAGAAPAGPVFAHTRSLNLHVSKLRIRNLGLERAFDGFQGPAAAAVQRMDRCFGTFVDRLTSLGLYDDSIIVLTSDHGDSLGEAHRWGHAYTLFPEIVRTPLLMHVPERLRRGLTADLDAASFSTDITPTLYRLLGYESIPPGPMYGASLFVAPGAETSWRRRDRFLLSSSYGPVYGLLLDNGQMLYIADGLNRRDYAYDISALRPVRVGVTESLRAESRAAIRRHIDDIGALYHYVAEP